MTDEEKNHYKQLLLEQKQALLTESEKTLSHIKNDAHKFSDVTDQATQEEEFTLELRSRDREYKLIKKIDAALARLQEDEYGDCETCGIEINPKRLQARPTATECIDCKSLAEIKERQQRDD